MKRKLKLSVLNIESFVTSEEKRNTIVGGSLPTDTNNYFVCINYSGLTLCRTVETTCVYSDNPAICLDRIYTVDLACANTYHVCVGATRFNNIC